MWLETDDGPVLGLHLGMSGRILVDPEDTTRWDRFTVEFEDGGRLVLRDKRRLGRAVLNPDYSHIGPDAAVVSRDDFRRLIGAGHTPIKARLLNQGAISGVGNLLADEALWQARISPAAAFQTYPTTTSISCAATFVQPSARRSARAARTPGASSPPASATAYVPATATRWSVGRSAAGRLVLVP